ncbi:hypothetical protein WSS15_09670 [Acetobacter pasteurianus]|uniref:hypothetical protein n=1 Tax=Acetobacter pasteurianus TaxID=438 RepID=UPI001427B07C|nr:hypothetical protein [Acetobacter pasteurianus]WKC16440.1 hypothetical protein FCN51_14450 [Acetobacter pasteurianus]GLH28317.1 hypothetical protein WSS15_09670 [Acetobacter pasteurianus]
MFLTETECERTAKIVPAELCRCMHSSPSGSLMIEVVDVNRLFVSLRGGGVHD